MVDRQHELGAVPPDRRCDVAPQRRTELDDAVVVVEELHDRHPDSRGRGALLGLAQRTALGGRDAVDPRLTPGDQ